MWAQPVAADVPGAEGKAPSLISKHLWLENWVPAPSKPSAEAEPWAELMFTCKERCRPPCAPPSAHLTVQEAVENRDEEALEGDKQRSHHRATASGNPQAQELESNPGVWGGLVLGRGRSGARHQLGWSPPHPLVGGLGWKLVLRTIPGRTPERS